ncbi:MAG: magnesium transporter [Gammaproteobacteria bacterium]|nr:magnesium transporter [Gammaproteobacteria bacterium]
MAEIIEQDKTPDRLEAFTQALEHGRHPHLRKMLNDLHPAEIALLLESLPEAQRELTWELVYSENRGDVLAELNDEVRAKLLRQMETHELVSITEELDTDDLVDILQDLPDRVVREALASLDKQNRHRIEAALRFDEDSAGGLMSTETVTVRADVTLDVVLRYLRMRGEIPDLTDSLFVVNRFDTYLGLLALSDLLTHDPGETVADVMSLDTDGISPEMEASEVALLFEKRDLVSAPVIDDHGRLLGRITIDDVVDYIREEADEAQLARAGLDPEDDIFAPVVTSTRRRAVWLGINLVTAFMAAYVIGLFERTIEQIVALAVLMPIVASMGGIAGGQTLTLTIRGLALGQVTGSNSRWLMTKELAVGGLNGLIWALVVAGVAVYWFGDLQIGYVIAAAIVINLVCGAAAGITIPLVMRRLDIDPALAGNVVLTTVTDVVGFMAFLGLATLFLL